MSTKNDTTGASLPPTYCSSASLVTLHHVTMMSNTTTSVRYDIGKSWVENLKHLLLLQYTHMYEDLGAYA